MKKGIRVQVYPYASIHQIEFKPFFLEDLFYFLPEKDEIFDLQDFIDVNNFDEDLYLEIDSYSWSVEFRAFKKDNKGMYVSLFLKGE